MFFILFHLNFPLTDFFWPDLHFFWRMHRVIFVATKKSCVSQWTFQDCTLIGRTENILLVAEYIDFGCKHVSQRAFLLGCPIFESSDKCSSVDEAQSHKKNLLKKLTHAYQAVQISSIKHLSLLLLLMYIESKLALHFDHILILLPSKNLCIWHIYPTIL